MGFEMLRCGFIPCLVLFGSGYCFILLHYLLAVFGDLRVDDFLGIWRTRLMGKVIASVHPAESLSTWIGMQGCTISVHTVNA